MRKATRFAVFAAAAAAATQAYAVSNLNLNFGTPATGTSTNPADSGFSNVYNPTPDPLPPDFSTDPPTLNDRAGFYLGPVFNYQATYPHALNIWTQPGDTFGRYESDPDDAKNVFYSNFDAGDRTTITAHVIYQNLNTNFHGGGVWIGTDEDHYARFGFIHNSGSTNPADDRVNAELLRENEDLWPPQGQGSNPPFSGHAGDGNDIAGVQVRVPGSNWVAADQQYAQPQDVLIQLILTGHTVKGRFSKDNGATWTYDQAGGIRYLAGVATSQKNGASVEGGLKVGAYAFGGGANNALVSFVNYTAQTVSLPRVTWTSASDGSGLAGTNWSEDVTLNETAVEGRTVELPAAGTGRRTINIDTADMAAGNLIFSSPAGYTITTGAAAPNRFNLVINDGFIDVQAGSNEIAAPMVMGGFARISGQIHVAAGASLKLSGDTVPRLMADDTQPGVKVDAGGKLDLVKNSLQVDYLFPAEDPFTAILNMVKAGYNGGKWDGNGIVSSAAGAATGTGLAVYDTGNSPWAWQRTFGPHQVGTANPTGSDVSPGSSTRDVLVMYTWLGDTNLDGKVDATDLATVTGALGTSSGALWKNGDFNYDGRVSADDLALMNLGIALSAGATLPVVPEPAAASLAALASLVLASRRRARRPV